MEAIEQVVRGSQVEVVLRIDMTIEDWCRTGNRRVAAGTLVVNLADHAPLQRQAEIERRIPGHACLVLPVRDRSRGGNCAAAADRSVETGAIIRFGQTVIRDVLARVGSKEAPRQLARAEDRVRVRSVDVDAVGLHATDVVRRVGDEAG